MLLSIMKEDVISIDKCDLLTIGIWNMGEEGGKRTIVLKHGLGKSNRLLFFP